MFCCEHLLLCTFACQCCFTVDPDPPPPHTHTLTHTLMHVRTQNGKRLFGSPVATKLLMFVEGNKPPYSDDELALVEEVEARFHGKVQTIIIPVATDQNKKALRYFGVKVTETALPAYKLLHVEAGGRQRFAEYLFDETCMPFCKSVAFERDLDNGDIVAFVDTEGKSRGWL